MLCYTLSSPEKKQDGMRKKEENKLNINNKRNISNYNRNKLKLMIKDKKKRENSMKERSNYKNK